MTSEITLWPGAHNVMNGPHHAKSYQISKMAAFYSTQNSWNLETGSNGTEISPKLWKLLNFWQANHSTENSRRKIKWNGNSYNLGIYRITREFVLFSENCSFICNWKFLEIFHRMESALYLFRTYDNRVICKRLLLFATEGNIVSGKMIPHMRNQSYWVVISVPYSAIQTVGKRIGAGMYNKCN